MSKIKLMSHLVAGYPTEELSFTAARALVDGGADILEIQLPFSDPSADGPAIQGACTEVLKRGFRTADGLAFIARLHKEFPQVKIYLMSYGSLVYTPGVENFCERAAAAGVKDFHPLLTMKLPFKKLLEVIDTSTGDWKSKNFAILFTKLYLEKSHDLRAST